jgi:hypothetical protein
VCIDRRADFAHGLLGICRHRLIAGGERGDGKNDNGGTPPFETIH